MCCLLDEWLPAAEGGSFSRRATALLLGARLELGRVSTPTHCSTSTSSLAAAHPHRSRAGSRCALLRRPGACVCAEPSGNPLVCVDCHPCQAESRRNVCNTRRLGYTRLSVGPSGTRRHESRHPAKSGSRVWVASNIAIVGLLHFNHSDSPTRAGRLTTLAPFPLRLDVERLELHSHTGSRSLHR